MFDLMLWSQPERFDATAQLVKKARVTADRYPKYSDWIENMGKVSDIQKRHWDTPTHIQFKETAQTGKPDFEFRL